MFTSSAINYLFRGLMPAVLVLGIFISASAQGGVGSTRGLPDAAGGLHTIEGHVYLPSGRRVGPGVVVKLEGNVNGLKSAVTDADGAFLFRSLPAAEYLVVIDGNTDYEGVRESVAIYGNTGGIGLGPAGQTVMLDLHLKPKGSMDSEKMLSQFPKAAVDNYKKGLDASQAGDHKKAVELLKQAVSVSPTFAPAQRELGSQYMKLNSFDKAAETYDAFLKLQPTDASAHLNLGIALYNLNKLEPAESHLREALKQSSSGPMAHYYLGLTLIKTKRYPEAQQEMESAIANGGANLAQAHKFLGGLYISAHKNKEAADELEKYLQLDPKAANADQLRNTIKELRGKQ